MRVVKTLAMVALLLGPTGVVMGAQMSETTQSVESHTTFVEILIGQDDKDRELGYGAVAGIVHCPPSNQLDNAVLWFNDQVLFRHGKSGPSTNNCEPMNNITHVWLTEEDAPDPRENPSLQHTNVTFEFTDPNGMTWTVNEYKYHVLFAEREESTLASVNDVTVESHADAELRKVPFYTWVVEIQPETFDPTIQEPYNFVNVVDFEKLTFGPDGREGHDGEPSDPREGNSHDKNDPDEEHHFPHKHYTADVRLWPGEEPQPGSPGDEGASASIVVVTPDQIDGPSFGAGPVDVE